jgi:3-hydroxy-9,10-secoandrosta-1,3,5(10)-triene-9,17-dione monooxygenase
MDAPSKPNTVVPTSAQLIARVRALVPVLAERAAEAEAERCLPDATIADMQAAGLVRVLQPKRWDGYELDVATYFEVQLALAAAASVPSCSEASPARI